jgi:hypothetical protein
MRLNLNLEIRFRSILVGSKLIKKDGLLVLSVDNNQQLKVYSSGNNIAPLPVAVSSLKSKFDEFESTYIDITADVEPEPLPGQH